MHEAARRIFLLPEPWRSGALADMLGLHKILFAEISGWAQRQDERTAVAHTQFDH